MFNNLFSLYSQPFDFWRSIRRGWLKHNSLFVPGRLLKTKVFLLQEYIYAHIWQRSFRKQLNRVVLGEIAPWESPRFTSLLLCRKIVAANWYKSLAQKVANYVEPETLIPITFWIKISRETRRSTHFVISVTSRLVYNIQLNHRSRP